MTGLGRQNSPSLGYLRPLFGFFLAFAIAGPPGSGQVQTVPPQRHEVSVTLKLIRVFVTDAAGKPAMDLRPDDFRIIDNGVSQKIKAFEVYVDSSTPGRPPEAASVKEPRPAAPAKIPVPQKTAPQKFIFLFDTTNNDMQGLSLAGRAAMRFLDSQVRPGDEVAVLTLSGIRGIEMIEYLTRDLAKVRAAIGRVKSVPGRRWLAEIEIFGRRPDMGKAPEEREADAENASQRPHLVFTRHLPLLAQAFRGIEGTKNVLLFSSGFQTILKVPSIGGAAGRMMAASDMPVYAINTEIAKKAVQTITNQEANPPAEDTNPSGQGTLQQIASLSGGRAFAGQNAIVRFERIAEDIQASVRNYYILGYDVETGWDGRYHRIQVEALKPGFIAHAQSGYFAPKPFPQWTKPEKDAQLMDLALREASESRLPAPLPLSVRTLTGGPIRRALVMSEIPADRFGGSLGTRIELFLMGLDENREIALFQRSEIDVTALPRGAIIPYSVLDIGPGPRDIRIILRDMETGKGMAAAAAIESEPALKAFRIEAPCLLAPREKTRFLRLETANGDTAAETKTPARELVEVYPFNLDEAGPVLGPLPALPSRLLVAFVCAPLAADDVPTLEVSITDLASGQKTEVESGILALKAKDGRAAILAELNPLELKKGFYRIELKVVDASNSAAQASADLRIGP